MIADPMVVLVKNNVILSFCYQIHRLSDIIKSIIVLSSSVRAKLKRHKRFIHLIGSKKL